MIEQPLRCRRSRAAARACAHAAALRTARMVGDGRVQRRIATCVRGIGARRGGVRTDDGRFFTPPIRPPSAA
ncbi:hypothetical protein NRY95_14065 [Xanthomonas campestris pv. phormiicola]|nr:hypothetical protein [Xanthomonas campestris pv. phormiicola]UYC14852.1 hypothetical protein NRY95_14065 [Xanthomonas campestris pv. phormiicola]